MTVTANRQWRLKRRPTGQFDQFDFELATVPVREVRDGEFLVRLTHLSVDPTQRIWVGEESYLPIQPIGEVMRCIAVGVVERSRNVQFPAGTQVSGIFGAEEYAVWDGQGVNPLPPGLPPEAALAVFGHIGMTAYFGVTDIGRPKAGETIAVSGPAAVRSSAAVSPVTTSRQHCLRGASPARPEELRERFESFLREHSTCKHVAKPRFVVK